MTNVSAVQPQRRRAARVQTARRRVRVPFPVAKLHPEPIPAHHARGQSLLHTPLRPVHPNVSKKSLVEIGISCVEHWKENDFQSELVIRKRDVRI
jgi:hypothetical protein